VEEALARVITAVRHHLAFARAPDGLLAEVDETRPTLGRQAHELRCGYADFLTDFRALREEVRRAALAFQPATDPFPTTRIDSVVDFGAIRRQGEQLLARLQGNRDAEAKLVLETFNTDLGAGD
jgi:hypothetical protein